MKTSLFGRARAPLASSQYLLIAIAALVGVGSGLASYIFFRLIVYFTDLGGRLAPLGSWRFSLYGAIGGLLVGPMIYFWAREAKGHGVPEVMEAVAVKGGRIRARVAVVKSIASAITIGTGGSAGREGPIVQIGSALGSTIAQGLRLTDDRVKTLVACGAAAGIAATFNAPIAGVFFALEIILGQFTAGTFSLLVVSSVTAAAVARWLVGNHPAFMVSPYELARPEELIFYVILGVIAALTAQLYSRTLYGLEDVFDNQQLVPDWVKPAIGGLLFGALGALVPQTLGRGEDIISTALAGVMPPIGALTGQAGSALLVPVLVLGALGLLKILSTSLTIGSGGSGGIFFPGLYIGAMVGGAFGWVVHAIYPWTANPGAYAMVGMAAVFAGMTQAPITGIIILFEMTQDYRIILPLMLSSVIATLLSSRMSEETIYTMKLARRGIKLRQGHLARVMASIPVSQAMTTPVSTVHPDMPLSSVISLMQSTRHNGFPVVEGDSRLIGIVALEDIRGTPLEGRLQRKVREVMTTALVVAKPDDDLESALQRMTERDIGRLPVVSADDPTRLVGLVTRSDLLNAYQRRLTFAGEQGEGPAAPPPEVMTSRPGPEG